MEKNPKVITFEELYKPQVVNAETIRLDLKVCEDNLLDPTRKGFEQSIRDVDMFYKGDSVMYN